jgi:hypothetical protein
MKEHCSLFRNILLEKLKGRCRGDTSMQCDFFFLLGVYAQYFLFYKDICDVLDLEGTI